MSKYEEMAIIEEPLSLRKFNILDTIGKGAFGSVKAIEDKVSKKIFALKFINKKLCIREKSLLLIFKERILLQSMSHPYIISLRYAFQDDENLFMVLDLALGGDLRLNMQRNPEFDEYTLLTYVAEISSAIHYIHDRMVIHRDLKPENLLLDESGHILLTDFNLASSVEKRKPSSKSGTLEYMAPEMHLSKPYSFSIDWWALGLILYELVYRKLPFAGRTADEIIAKSKSAPLVFPDFSHAKRKVTRLQEREDFTTCCLQRDVKIRMGSSNFGRGFNLDVKQHPYLINVDWVAIENKKIQPKYKPQIEKDTLNIPPSIHIEEMLLGHEKLEYKPRKKATTNKKTLADKISYSLSSMFGSNPAIQPPKPKSRKQIERDQMDKYYIDFNYEKPNQLPMKLPESQKELLRKIASTTVSSPNLLPTKKDGNAATPIDLSDFASSSDIFSKGGIGYHVKQQSRISLISVASTN